MNVADVRTAVRQFGLSLVRSSVDRQPTWRTPDEWSDADGLRSGGGQVWLYRQLPVSVLRDHDLLDRTLGELARVADGRQVQLLTHTWDHMPEPPAATPSALAAFQRSSLRFLVPTRSVSIGVQLVGADTTVTPVRGDVVDGVDELLGERTPRFAAYDEDRARVSAALARVGASVPSGEPDAFLGAWYTLGALVDTSGEESDELITLADGSLVELCSIETVDRDGAPQSLPDVERGATVVSVRGTLALRGSDGELTSASVIYGRRSSEIIAPWVVALRSMPTVTPQPLPLRQLGALHETLPCSPNRLAASHHHLGAAQLAALGFADTSTSTLDVGLLIGLGGRRMTSPTYLNPLSGGGLSAVVGDPGSGRTFLCELLAAQAHLGGFSVTYVSSDDAEGQGFAALSSAPRWRPAAAGELDPFRWAPAPVAVELHRSHLQGMALNLSNEEQEALHAGFSRAAVMGVTSLVGILELADSAAVAAKVLRAVRRDPQAQMLVADAGSAHADLPESLWVELSSLGTSPSVGVAAAALTAHVAGRSARPHLVVLDGLAEHMTHPLWSSVWKAVLENPTVAVLVVLDAGTVLPPELAGAAHRFALSSDDPATLTFVGLEPTAGKVDWLAGAGPVLAAEGVLMPAACVYRDPDGTTTSIDIGPWGSHVLTALTFGAVDRYA